MGNNNGVGMPTPMGRDRASKNLAEVVSILEGSGQFGRPVVQSGGNGTETLMRCPLCAGDGSDTHGRMLRVARRIDGGEVPYIGCRNHSDPEDWKRLLVALKAVGVPERLLASGSGVNRPEPLAGFPERPEGLGETDPVDPEAIAEWSERLWSPEGSRYLTYLRRRGLRDETIVIASLGLGAFAFGPDKRPMIRITIPIFGADGMVVNVRLSSIKAGVKRLPLPHPEMLNEEGDRFLTYGAPPRLYGIDRVPALSDVEGDGDPTGYLYVVAGEFDRLLLCQEGFDAVSGTGGEGTLPWKRDGVLLRDRHVVIIYDCDMSGRKGARKFARAATEEGASSVRIVDLDPIREDGYDLGNFLTEQPSDVAVEALIASIAATKPHVVEKRAVRPRSPAWDFTDLGIAEQVAFRDQETLRFVEETSTWISWDEKYGVWRGFPRGDIAAPKNSVVEYVREVSEEFRDAEEDSAEDTWRKFTSGYTNAGRAASAVNMLSTIWDMRVSISSLDARPELINVANGVLGLETSRIFPHAPEYLLMKCTRGAVLEEGPLTQGEKEWNKFMARTVPDLETRDALQMMAGVSLLDGNPLQSLVFLVGRTGTGKSVFAELFSYAMGDYAGSFNLSMFRDNQDERPRADLVRALTQRVVFASETSEKWHLHVDQIKRLTGEDMISARLPHAGEYVERMPAFTPWFRTNQPPHIESPDLALYRRLIVFPFEQTYEGKRGGAGMRGSYVVEVRDLVADAVVTWAVEGLLEWCDTGRGPIKKSAEMLGAEFKFREELNDLQAFLAEETEPDSSGRVVFKELYDRYVNWSFDAGVNTRDVLTKKTLGQRLSGLGFGIKFSNSVTYRTGLVFKKRERDVR